MKLYSLLLILLCIGSVQRIDAQVLVIVPKPGPIVLHLDATGNYRVQLSDVATIGGTYNSYSLSPSSFNCSSTGPQTVIVHASNTTGNDPVSQLNYPYGIVTDASGNIYVADAGNNQIKKINPQGIVTVFAGSGTIGSADGLGLAASFNRPWGITMDSNWNIYVADAGNNKIRKITPTGLVTTVAGNGSKGSVDGLSSASFNNTAGVAVDAGGNIYVVDSDNNKIRKITPDGIVSTFAGNGLYSSLDGTGTDAGFYNPHGIAINKSTGNLYITDGDDRIRVITPDAMVTTLAGNNAGHADGTGTAASFYFPIGITIDSNGDMYIGDSGNNLIRKVTVAGVVTTIAGNGSIGSDDGTGTNASIGAPIGVAVDPSGNLYVTEGPSNKIRKITPARVMTTLSLVGSTDVNTLSASLPVDVIVESQPVITSTYNDITISAYPGCSPVLPDYTPIATASDNCQSSAITFTQVPAAGTPLTPGTPVTVTLTATDASGGTADITFNINVADVSGPPITFGSDPVISKGGKVQLNPQINGDIASYSWSPNIGLSDAAIKNPVASPSVNTTYTLTATTTGGCTASADVTVNVLQQVVIPNAFTPNGDGVNDFWNITELSNYPACTVDIFSRNGQLIFHSIGYSKPWAGTYNGSELPTGAYYYVIDLKDGAKKLAGQVTIIK